MCLFHFFYNYDYEQEIIDVRLSEAKENIILEMQKVSLRSNGTQRTTKTHFFYQQPNS